MAYMSQERKKEIAVEVKKVLSKYGLKGSLSVRNHSALVLKVKSGKINFISNYNSTVDHVQSRPAAPAKDYLNPNPYWFQNHFSGKALAALRELFNALNKGNHNRSDMQSDYFDVGWYVDLEIGSYHQPYVVTK